jgi:hypothetical protein
MMIEAWLAARSEPRYLRDGGFHIWAALVYVDGVLTWTDLHCLGRLPNVSFAYTQHVGALAVLRKLAELSAANLDAGIRFQSDSQVLAEELQGTVAVQRDPKCQELVDKSRGLVLWMEPVLTLRYCHFRDNQVAHEMISQFCKEHPILRSTQR